MKAITSKPQLWLRTTFHPHPAAPTCAELAQDFSWVHECQLAEALSHNISALLFTTAASNQKLKHLL